MTMTKLTLSADKELIEKAKKLARRQNTSVSALFSRYLTAITQLVETPATGPLTSDATGLIKLPRRQRAKTILADALIEKYGLAE